MNRVSPLERVPWKQVLNDVRRELKRRVKQYYSFSEIRDEEYRKHLQHLSQQEMREALETYSALRSFLGYLNKTAIEREAADLLDQKNSIGDS